MFTKLSKTERDAIRSSDLTEFEPPDIDPSDPAVDDYLNSLVKAMAIAIPPTPTVEALLGETGAYFRRPSAEIIEKLNRHYVDRVTSNFDNSAPAKDIPASLARILLIGDVIARFAYTDLAKDSGDGIQKLPGLWLVGTDDDLLVLKPDESSEPVWSATNITIERDKGFVIDDCRISGGTWFDKTESDAVLVAQGTIRGRYQNWFAPLIARGES